MGLVYVPIWGKIYSAALQFIIASHYEEVAMPSAVWSGHLHFGLVAMPVRLLVAARTKTTRFRRLYRKPVNADPSAMSFPSFSHDRQDPDSDLNDGIGETRFTPEEINARRTARHQYSTVRQVLQSEVTGEEIRPDEVIKGYEIAPNEFAAINPQEIQAAEIETSDTLIYFILSERQTLIRSTSSDRTMSLLNPVRKRLTRCCSKQCGKRSAWGLPELGCTDGSTC
jgi:hypothetical protein